METNSPLLLDRPPQLLGLLPQSSVVGLVLLQPLRLLLQLSRLFPNFNLQFLINFHSLFPLLAHAVDRVDQLHVPHLQRVQPLLQRIVVLLLRLQRVLVLLASRLRQFIIS